MRQWSENSRLWQPRAVGAVSARFNVRLPDIVHLHDTVTDEAQTGGPVSAQADPADGHPGQARSTVRPYAPRVRRREGVGVGLDADATMASAAVCAASAMRNQLRWEVTVLGRHGASVVLTTAGYARTLAT